ncbi:MAG TPA: GIY-YIG nuclease family protein [Bradyrhizobium sp.]|nr:GIY-YIG nuclease family protein [Bradyrhizobium sp.]
MRDQILNEIKRLASANGGQPLGVRAFERESGIREAAWRGIYWARWGDALIEAGYAPNEWQGKHDTDLIFQKFTEACRHFSRIATKDELNMYGRMQDHFPTSKSFYTHFGSKNALLENLRAWATNKSDYADIIAMLGAGSEAATERAKPKEGLVYLIKSGAHYKIGRSDELERRVKEIRIALPEAASLVHSIRTDDPAGIEAYWHRRFIDRRANGEWFKLTNADVAAFKRRKYQ